MEYKSFERRTITKDEIIRDNGERVCWDDERREVWVIGPDGTEIKRIDTPNIPAHLLAERYVDSGDWEIAEIAARNEYEAGTPAKNRRLF